MNYYNINALKNITDKKGLTNVLEYPNKCKGPIQAEYSYSEQRRDSGIDRRRYY